MKKNNQHIHYEICFNTVVLGKPCVCLCNKEDINGNHYCFAMNEEDAKERIDALAKVGVQAFYKKIENENHWIYNNLD